MVLLTMRMHGLMSLENVIDLECSIEVVVHFVPAHSLNF